MKRRVPKIQSYFFHGYDLRNVHEDVQLGYWDIRLITHWYLRDNEAAFRDEEHVFEVEDITTELVKDLKVPHRRPRAYIDKMGFLFELVIKEAIKMSNGFIYLGEIERIIKWRIDWLATPLFLIEMRQAKEQEEYEAYLESEDSAYAVPF